MTVSPRRCRYGAAMTKQRSRSPWRRPPRLVVHSDTAPPDAASPKLPHEHDESPETRPVPDPALVQGHADLERGLVDTDRREEAGRAFDCASPPARKKPPDP